MMKKICFYSSHFKSQPWDEPCFPSFEQPTNQVKRGKHLSHLSSSAENYLEISNLFFLGSSQVDEKWAKKIWKLKGSASPLIPPKCKQLLWDFLDLSKPGFESFGSAFPDSLGDLGPIRSPFPRKCAQSLSCWPTMDKLQIKEPRSPEGLAAHSKSVLWMEPNELAANGLHIDVDSSGRAVPAHSIFLPCSLRRPRRFHEHNNTTPISQQIHRLYLPSSCSISIRGSLPEPPRSGPFFFHPMTDQDISRAVGGMDGLVD